MATVPVLVPAVAETSLGRSRYLAAVAGGALVAVFLLTAVRHPAEGWLASIGCGVPMVCLVQFARTGRAWQLGSLGWYAAWYSLFSVTWLVARAFEAPPAGSPLGPQASIGVFLGTVVAMGGASRARSLALSVPLAGLAGLPNRALPARRSLPKVMVFARSIAVSSGVLRAADGQLRGAGCEPTHCVVVALCFARWGGG